jgi:hypothetical protein
MLAMQARSGQAVQVRDIDIVRSAMLKSLPSATSSGSIRSDLESIGTITKETRVKIT